MKSLEERKREIFRKFPKLKSIPEDKFPQHIFIIPDGNRRYARKHGKPELWGHRAGFKVAVKLLRYFRPLPIRAVTLWGFAADNWKRDKKEVDHVMGILGFIIDNYLDELQENNSRFVHLGRKDRIPKALLKKFDQAEEKTKNNSGQIICLAVDFGGEDQAVRLIEKARDLPRKQMVNGEVLWNLRDTQGLIRSADLLFRTSETRTSDVGWINGSHTVLYFLTNKLFPEISEQDVYDALIYYVNTKRNEGR
ncbi:MAG: di-trans,poly-cis-decaprenylcistransferase [Candidatus Levybacteria bacterium]|nr:di-trans,poly-cis-decaprenylcistransferase [Candidatus Levybacteria bacterium]